MPFTTAAELTAALNGMVAGDYIYYAGTGVLTISSSSGVAFNQLINRNPSGIVSIDFGNAPTLWTPGGAGNYVKFSYTGTSNTTNAVTIRACSNLRIYGGMATTNSIGGVGVIPQAPLDNIHWLDLLVDHVGLSGWGFRGQDSGNAASHIRNCTIRSEINRFSMKPDADTHPDKGTGNHGMNIHGITGEISNMVFAVYAHDSLRPNEVVNGVTYPEGGGGSAIEIGNDVGGPLSDYTIYVLAEHNNMHPNGSGNPGSSGGGQTGTNGINVWGNIPLERIDVPWLECNDISGSNFHVAGTGWRPSLGAIQVDHGRGTNTNQWATGNSSQRYMADIGVSYSADCL